MPLTIPKSVLLSPKVPSIAVVGLLAAQFLILQNIGEAEPMCLESREASLFDKFV
jgi:hypothetical protein